MGRRRRRHRSRYRSKGPKRPRNLFANALKATPSSDGNKLVFPYDYSLKDYNLSIFGSMHFQGATTRAELDLFLKELANCVTWYKVSKYGFRVPDAFFVVFYILGLVVVMIGNLLKSGVVSGFGFLGCFFIGASICLFGQCIYEARLNAREKDVRAFLKEMNPLWMARGMEWSTYDYGAYLRLTYNVDFIVRSRDMQGGGALQGPAPMQGGEGISQPSPNQWLGKKTLVGAHQLVPLGLGPLDPDDSVENNIVMS